MARADLAFAARQRHVDLRAVGQAQLEHAKRAPHRVDAAEFAQNVNQLLDRQAVDLDVDIFHRQAAQQVAHRAADDVRAAAGAHKRFEQRLNFGNCVYHSVSIRQN